MGWEHSPGSLASHPPVPAKASADTAQRVLQAHLGIVAHNVVETSKEAQAGADLHVHGSVHVVKQVQGLIDELTALLQEACRAPPRVARSGLGQGTPLPPATPGHAPCCTLACPLWKKWKASEAFGLTCLTTGKILSTSSSVNAGLWRLSKLYSFSRIWGTQPNTHRWPQPQAHMASTSQPTTPCQEKAMPAPMPLQTLQERGRGRALSHPTWIPVFREISRSSVIFCRP